MQRCLLERSKMMSHDYSPELLSAYECPVACFQKVMNGKYKLRILWDLRDGSLRYEALRKSQALGIPSGKEIAPRVLSRELKVLTNLRWIQRKEYDVVTPKVEYRLTDVWQRLIPVISALHQWGVTYLVGEAAAAAGLTRRAPGL